MVKVKDEIKDKNMLHILKIPVPLLLPLGAAQVLGFGSERMKFDNNFVEYGFSPKTFGLAKEQNMEMLEDVGTEFPSDDKNEALSLIVDQNFINHLFINYAKVDKMYSMRTAMKGDPRGQMLTQLMTTTSLGMVLPSIKEEYGEGKKVDVVGTLSHEFLQDKVPELKISGVTISAKGIISAQINFGMQLIIEKSPDEWVDARSFYSTFKMEISVEKLNLTEIRNERAERFAKEAEDRKNNVTQP